MNETTKRVKPSMAEALRAQAAALEAQANALRAQAEALPETTDRGSEILNVEQTLEQYGIGRDGLHNAARRGELTLHRGARNRVMVERSELERWIKSRTVMPRKAAAAPAADLDAWERQADASLRAIGGRR